MAITKKSNSDKFKKIALVSGAILIALILIYYVLGNIGGLLLKNIKSTNLSNMAPSSANIWYLSDSSTGYSAPEAYQTVKDSVSSVTTDRKVEKNGSLKLLVKSAEESAKNIQNTAERLGGFVSNSYVYEVSLGIKAGQVVIRVPASSFNVAMDEIKKLAVKVEQENSSAQDVTEQYVDLTARLNNFKTQEEQYLGILKKAKTIEEILNVSSRLNEVRLQIEQLEGQLKYLNQQIDLAAIAVNLTEEGDIEVFGLRWRPLYVAKVALRDMMSGLTDYADAMIKFIFQLPVIILWLATFGLIIFAVWKVIKWVWEKIKNHNP